MNVLVALHPKKEDIKKGQAVVMWLTAIVSFFTALAGFPLLPAIANAIKGVELSSDGKLQLTESYLIEVVDMIKESILVLSEDLVVLKCNDVSKVLFGAEIVGTNICDCIHPADLPVFKDAIAQAAESYTFGATTIEVRIEQESSTSSPKFNPQKHLKISASKFRKADKSYKVYTTEEPHAEVDNQGDIEMGERTPLNADREAERAQLNYIWIEVTVCKGKQVMMKGSLEHDIKLVCRNIDDRKKRQACQALVEITEERGRTNAAKLRYISCIAHDLKTPLQSFTFSLDLLNETDLHPEQRELIEHATIAIDLMRLTISQTMDISKALTGAKLMPRRATVHLSSVLNRVKIIINGYGKQVPVSFEVAPDLCDEIITDEEWLWQMLLNLLTNACKYTDRGSIIVRLSVTTLTSGSAEERMSCFSLVRGQSIPVLSIPQEVPYMLLCEVLDTGKLLPLCSCSFVSVLCFLTTSCTRLVTGIGISPDKIGHIFDAFAQVQEGQVTGTGLGLFGVRTRAEGLLGTCGARHNTESSTGTGTVLWFALPYVPNVDSGCSLFSTSSSPKQGHHLALQAFEALQTPGSALERKRVRNLPSPCVSPRLQQPTIEITVDTPSTRGFKLAPIVTSVPLRASLKAINQPTAEVLIRALKLTAMVVEDTPTVRKLMEKLLLSMGFKSVVCYENGSKGLEAMMAAPVDIVFSDVQMPIMTGPEVCF